MSTPEPVHDLRGRRDPGTGPACRVRLREHSPRAGARVLEVTGEIDLTEAGAIRYRMCALLARSRPERVALDLSGVTYLGSHGLTAVVDFSRAAQEAGVRVVGVTGPDNRAVTRPVRMTGLDRVVDWYPDLDSAFGPSGT